MIYKYTDSTNTVVHVIGEDGISRNSMLVTALPEGAEILQADTPALEQRKAEKQSEIDSLEASQYMTRGEREGWLAMIEAQATAQSVPLDVLYAANPFYKKLKDVNTAVTALRAELKAIV